LFHQKRVVDGDFGNWLGTERFQELTGPRACLTGIDFTVCMP